MEPVEALVSFVSELRYEDLPPVTVAATKRQIADALACALAGSAAPLTPEIVARHVQWGGAPEATVLGYGHRLPAPTAAWLNAAMIHAHDFDDSHRASNQHIYVTLLPAALATAESLNQPLAGRDLITALVGAAELQIRLGLSVLPHMHVGWLPTAVFGGLGAAAVSGKLLGLPAEGIANAVGLAYTQAQGNRQGLLEGTIAKRLTPAFSARAGVHAAALAGIGVTGPRALMTGAFGLHALFGGGKGDAAILTAGLGERFSVDDIALKPYPCCRAAHRPIDMALEAKAQLQPFDPTTIAAVDAWLHPRAHALIGQPFRIRQNPQVDAQFSAQWTVAFALLHGPPGLPDFAPEAVRAATDVQMLAERIRVHRLSDAEPGTHERLTLRLQDGRQAAITHTDIKGEPSLPLTRSERLAKFLACAVYAHHPLDAETAESVFTDLEHIEEWDDIRPLVAQVSSQS
ncbi:MAG: MmgE/PrpD family protein [Chloroflexota bacterium]|nr:MmgE/PrpD family protein [Chloroflexota bacterium]MDE2841712.1 MmgE/PrpD family protein [Chloroflexota bacterium]